MQLDIRLFPEFVVIYIHDSEATIAGFLNVVFVSDACEVRHRDSPRLREEELEFCARIEDKLHDAEVSVPSQVLFVGPSEGSLSKSPFVHELVEERCFKSNHTQY